MNSAAMNTQEGRRGYVAVFAAVVIGWFPLAWIHLYYFAYGGADMWCYAAPATTARAPFALTMPFLGGFEGANRGWGLHWPGGPLLTSMVTPFLPHTPAVTVTIYLFYWVLLCAATAALAWRLTGSRWLALCGFLFVAGDHTSFGVAWLERYELLAATAAICGLLAICGKEEERPRLRLVVTGLAFFLMPTLQPISGALALAWVFCLGVTTWLLRRRWMQFWVAAAGAALGWAAFIGYYWSRPWLYAIFSNYARQNYAMAHANSPPSVGLAIHRVLHAGDPTKAGTVVYLTALAMAAVLLYGLWKARRDWREYAGRNDLALFSWVALVCGLALAQLNFTDVYWSIPWPFAVGLTCLAASRLAAWRPARSKLVWAGLAVVLALHCTYLPARTVMWRKLGFVNMRGRLREFVATLPKGGTIYGPEVMWEACEVGGRPILMNSIPGKMGDEEQKKYAAFIEPMIKKGDVLVTDSFQWYNTLIDPSGPGWKQVGRCTVIYIGTAANPRHGFDLTAYERQ